MLWKIGLFLLHKFIFLILGGSFESKSSSEDRQAISIENLELTQDFRSLQSENPVSGLISAVNESAVGLRRHLGFATPR